MLKQVYSEFNTKHFSPDRYQKVLKEIHTRTGNPRVRMCETPVFINRTFADEIIRGATDIIQQAMALGEKLAPAVAPEFRIPSAPEKPSFFIIDFAVTKDGPRLIELQAFASNLVFIPMVGKMYKDIYQLGDEYSYLLSTTAEAAIKKTILGHHAPENVILMEINPWEQQSQRDFVATQKWLGIPVVDVTDVIKKGRQLFYRDQQGNDIRIHRIYNRVIPTEFQSLQLSKKTRFKFTDELDVEWVGDPSWFLKISKYAMPYLDHPMVPETTFLDQVKEYPDNLENYVLKPVSFNAGIGVKLNITKEDLDAVPSSQRHGYILMRKVSFAPFIPDLKGNMLNAEIRVMFVWPDKLVLVAMSARVMHGNDTNASLWGDDAWCGMAPVLIVDQEE
ncbi:MAG: hypothetical protein HY052_08520 [Proteobacteria bacterium]|nr:hypothetical protein [Pseudomonadota bacterium]